MLGRAKQKNDTLITLKTDTDSTVLRLCKAGVPWQKSFQNIFVLTAAEHANLAFAYPISIHIHDVPTA